MGRTVRTFRDAVRLEEARWKGFRRVLKPRDREMLDQIFDYARGFADAGTMIVTSRITEVALVSTMVELLKEIDDLRSKVSRLEMEKLEIAP